MRKIIQNDRKKYNKSAIESVKDEAKRKGVECPSNTVPLMINQTHTSHCKGESLKMKTTQAMDTRSPKNSNYKSKTRAYKHMDSFKPCDTCKQIIALRKKLFVEFKSTLQEGDTVVESESISQATIDKSCNGREAHLPVINYNAVNSKLQQQFRLLSKHIIIYFAEKRFKSPLEKSDLVKSKERIEELLHKRRKQLFSFVRCQCLYDNNSYSCLSWILVCLQFLKIFPVMEILIQVSALGLHQF